MNNYSSVLAVAGSLCLTITLVLAWCLVGVRSSALMKRVFPSYQQLLKAHMDYSAHERTVDDLLPAVRPFPSLRIAGHSVCDERWISDEPCRIPRARDQAGYSTAPNQSIRRCNGGQFHVDDDRVRRGRLVRRSRSRTCPVTPHPNVECPRSESAGIPLEIGTLFTESQSLVSGPHNCRALRFRCLICIPRRFTPWRVDHSIFSGSPSGCAAFESLRLQPAKRWQSKPFSAP